MSRIMRGALVCLVIASFVAIPAQALAWTGNWNTSLYNRYTYSYSYQQLMQQWMRQYNWQQPAPTPAPAPQPSPAPQPTPPAPTPQPPSSGVNADEQYILNAVNAERAKYGLRPLQLDMRLVATARAKSQDMITNNYFAHQSPVLGSPFDQMRRAGISYRSAGENIAGTRTAEHAMQLWMNSPSHRANILHASYTHIGIGVVTGGVYGKMFTQHFIGL